MVLFVFVCAALIVRLFFVLACFRVRVRCFASAAASLFGFKVLCFASVLLGAEVASKCVAFAFFAVLLFALLFR